MGTNRALPGKINDQFIYKYLTVSDINGVKLKCYRKKTTKQIYKGKYKIVDKKWTSPAIPKF